MTTYREIYDAHGGIVRRVEYKPQYSEDGITWIAEQDCDAIVAANRRDEELDQSKRKFRHVARVPLEVINQAAREGWLHDKARWRRWLNDGANRDFRSWRGRI